MTFFSWVGYFPGGITVASQNAWQAAFGSYSYDPDLAKAPPLSNAEGKEQIQPGASGLLIVFLLVFLIALIAALFAVTVRVVPVTLPPAVERLRPWLWALVSAVTTLAFLFLLFQLLAGFSLTSRIRDRVETIGAHLATQSPADNPAAKKQAEIETALHAGAVRSTGWLWASFWLTLLAAVCAALTHTMSKRTSRPLPRIEFLR
jgi:hypothetical protein